MLKNRTLKLKNASESSEKKPSTFSNIRPTFVGILEDIVSSHDGLQVIDIVPTRSTLNTYQVNGLRLNFIVVDKSTRFYQLK